MQECVEITMGYLREGPKGGKGKDKGRLGKNKQGKNGDKVVKRAW